MIQQASRARKVAGVSEPEFCATKIGRNCYFETFASNMIILASTLVQGILVARLLGPAGRGQIALILFWPAFLAQMGTIGYDVSLARRAATRCDPRILVRRALLFVFILSGVVVIIGWLLVSRLFAQHPSDVRNLATLFLLTIPLSQMSLLLGAIDQGSARFRRFNFTRVLVSPCVIVLLLINYYSYSISLWSVILSYAGAMAFVAGLRLVWSVAGGIRRDPSISTWRMISDGLPFGLSKGVDTLYQRIDQLLLVILLGSHEIGLYIVALSVAGVVGSVANSAGMVSFTQTASLPPRHGGPLVTSLFRRMTVVCLLGSILVAGVIPWVLPRIYGSAFGPATGIALCLLPAVMLQSFAGFLDQCIRGQGNPYDGIKGRLLAMAFFAPVGWFASTHYRGYGLAVAFGLCQLLYFLWMIHQTRKRFSKLKLRMFFPNLKDASQLKLAFALKFRNAITRFKKV